MKKADELAHLVYRLTKNFPSNETFGIISQLRRAAISIPLNIIEGYARNNSKEYRRFLLISSGSLKELKYLLNFCFKEKLLAINDYKNVIKLSEEVARMIWSSIKTIENNQRNKQQTINKKQ